MKNKIYFFLILSVAIQFGLIQNIKGQTWHAMGSGIGTGSADTNSTVLAICANNGKLYAAGTFNSAGGFSANNIASWNGASWDSLGAGIGAGFGGVVWATAIYNGNLYVAGQFGDAGGNDTIYNVAEWNGTTWLPLGAGIGSGVNDSTSQVNALAVYNGKLYAAGAFSVAGGHSANNIAAWDGSTWSALSSGIGASDPTAEVSALVTYSGNLIAAGYFSTAGGINASSIAAWNGTGWSALGSGVTDGGNVNALAVYNSDLYLGGVFDSAGDLGVNNIAAWNGTAWLPTTALGAGIGNNDPNAQVDALVVNDNVLYVGGTFQLAGTVATSNIAQWSGSSWGALGTGVNLSTGPNPSLVDVFSLGVYNGNLYVGGIFNSAGGNTAHNIAEWQTTTGIDEMIKDNNVTIYPNPGKGYLNIALQNATGTENLQVYDMKGALVYQTKITSAITALDLRNAAQGPYLYRINSEEGTNIASGKFIIQ